MSGLLDETRYVLRDYLDPVAIINESGTVTERYRYDAFGPVSILAPDFSERTTSECAWNFLYHAEFQDTITGLYNYGYRYYAPNLGRWISRDPIEEKGGVNLYGFVGNAVVNFWDVLGNQASSKNRWRCYCKTTIYCVCNYACKGRYAGITRYTNCGTVILEAIAEGEDRDSTIQKASEAHTESYNDKKMECSKNECPYTNPGWSKCTFDTRNLLEVLPPDYRHCWCLDTWGPT